MSDESLFPDLSQTIQKALTRTRSLCPEPKGLWQASLNWCLADVM